MNSGRGVLAARFALVAAAVGVALVGVVGARRGEAPAGSSRPAGPAYACPMHPAVVSQRPGDCPVCGMALVSRGSVAPARGPGGAIASVAGWSWNDTVTRLGLQAPTRRAVWDAPSGPASVDAAGAVVALLYKDEVAGLADAETGLYFSNGAPDVGIVVRRVPAPAPARADRRASTAPVWFRRAESGAALAPGTAGWIKLAPKERQVLIAAAAAVLEGADGPYVLVAPRGSLAIARRPIEIGRVAEGKAAVTSGLDTTERLVTVGAFFMDVELRAREREGLARAD